MNGNAYIHIGATPENTCLEIPFPSAGGAAFDLSINIRTQQTASGKIVGQLAGKAKVSQTVSWEDIDSEKWYQIGRFFEVNSPFCYIRYFSHVLGRWVCEQFLVTDFSCNPDLIKADGSAKSYSSASFTITSTGAD